MTDISSLVEAMNQALKNNKLSSEKQQIFIELTEKIIHLTGGYIQRNELTKENAIHILALVAGMGINVATEGDKQKHAELLVDSAALMLLGSTPS